jgi:cytochrome c-type biogenesis protein CcmH
VLLVYARAAEGPRMPLAVQRGAAGRWPAAFRLDDSMAMTPGRTLSGQPRVVVVARLSATGEARLQPGDLFGESAPVAPGTSGLVVTIDRLQP